MSPGTVELADPLEALDRSQFFSTLPLDVRQGLASRLAREVHPVGAVIVREGDEGDRFYLVASGQLEVWSEKASGGIHSAGDRSKQSWTPDPSRHRLLARLVPGDGFGEMALLLGARRQATVVAASDVELFSLDGESFSHVVGAHRGLATALEEEMALRAASNSLGKSSPFVDLPPEALRWIAARVQQVSYEAGEEVVRQGEAGDAFYVIRSGSVSVLVAGPGQAERQVATLGPGDCFGEQALLTDEPRSATVRALEPSQLLRLDRTDFNSVLLQYKDQERYFVQLVVQRQRPKRIDPWVIEQMVGVEAEPYFILKNAANGRYIRLSEQGVFLWDLMDGEHSLPDLTMAYFARYQRFGFEEILQLVLQLHAAGFVRVQRLSITPAQSPTRPNALSRVGSLLAPWVTRYFSLPDVNGAVTWLYRYPLRPLYLWPVQVVLLATGLAGVAVFVNLLFQGGVPLPTGVGAESLAVPLFLTFCVQTLAHQVAHAATCSHFGREVHRAGVGWYLCIPVAFADTSDMWMSGRGARAVVSFAGPYTDFLMSGVATLLILLVQDQWTRVLLFQFACLGYLGAVSNLHPLIESDGYWVLMDWLDVPNLRPKSLAYLGSLLWRRPRPWYPTRVRRILTGYGGLALGYTVFVAASAVGLYQGFLMDTVSKVLPPAAATALGWAMAALITSLISAGTWRELRAPALSPHATALPGQPTADYS